MSFKKKILLVDADESVRRNFCAFLEAEGYEVDIAENSQHALEKTTQAFYHLIFLANTLPDIFGVDLIPKIKKQHPETAIIFITDFNTQEYTPQDFGTFPMITQPFNLEAIRYILQATLEKQHLGLVFRRNILRRSFKFFNGYTPQRNIQGW